MKLTSSQEHITVRAKISSVRDLEAFKEENMSIRVEKTVNWRKRSLMNDSKRVAYTAASNETLPPKYTGKQ